MKFYLLLISVIVLGQSKTINIKDSLQNSENNLFVKLFSTDKSLVLQESKLNTYIVPEEVFHSYDSIYIDNIYSNKSFPTSKYFDTDEINISINDLNSLDELIITSSKNSKPFIIGGKKKFNNYSVNLLRRDLILVYIPNKSNVSRIIKSINFFVKKNKNNSTENEIMLFLFDHFNGNFEYQNNLLTKEYKVKYGTKENKFVSINIEPEKITFPKNGIYIAILNTGSELYIGMNNSNKELKSFNALTYITDIKKTYKLYPMINNYIINLGL